MTAPTSTARPRAGESRGRAGHTCTWAGCDRPATATLDGKWPICAQHRDEAAWAETPERDTCGTATGIRRHQRAGEPICETCTANRRVRR